jgi:hypothetical protein
VQGSGITVAAEGTTLVVAFGATVNVVPLCWQTGNTGAAAQAQGSAEVVLPPGQTEAVTRLSLATASNCPETYRTGGYALRSSSWNWAENQRPASGASGSAPDLLLPFCAFPP